MEMPVFDLSLPKLLILAVLALVVFGPNELPKMASQAGRFLRELRKIADGAQADLREGLGPEFADFDLTDLSPRRFVQKHLLTDLDEPDLVGAYSDETRQDEVAADSAASAAAFAAAGEPVFDAEAT
jgi:sec-independent protein translocase protein TatB